MTNISKFNSKNAISFCILSNLLDEPSFIWYLVQKLLIGSVLMMMGSKFKQTVGLRHEGTLLAQNRGPIWI